VRRLPHAILLLFLFQLSGNAAAGALAAIVSPPGVAHYRFGDDPNGNMRWVQPNFDDSGWPIAQQVRWPEPAFESNGFMLVRISVPVRSDTAGPLGLRIASLSRAWMAQEVFVNGARVGNFGRLPPDSLVLGLPLDAVFDLPPGLTAPGAIAHIALRIWYPPFARRPGLQQANETLGTALDSGGPTAIETGKTQPSGFDAESFTFDQVRTLHAQQSDARAQARLRNALPATLNVLILLIGLAILLLARSSRSRDLYLYGAMLATLPWITLFFECIDARLLTLSDGHCVWFQVASQLPAMVITIEFIWRINGFRDLWFKRLTYASMALFNLGVLFAFTPVESSTLVAFSLVGYRVSLQAFNVLTLLANLWVIFVTRQRRLIAFAMLLVPAASLSEGFRNTSQSADLFDVAFFLAGFCLTAILAHQAWKEWRARDALQAEFEAARELQQRLVSPAVDLPGFRIESVYAPARHVGGDFFYVRPEEDGSIFVVVGDVSGKGLRAAMTVNSVMGALRTMPPLSPMRILGDLNRGLMGQMQNGFITCLVASIDGNGELTLANAGHLQPYRNGKEVQFESGLPLGIASSAVYSQITLELAPGESLTLLTDGVLEARDKNGELFGFDRTAAISHEPAETIARAAQTFGQEDDITVLTLQFAPGKLP
jgi:sigma-B regulation protein RsbU (phosphoserine phosphatase)